MTEPDASSGTVPPALLAILVCPADHGQLRNETSHLVCETCGRRYPVRDGVPDMIIDHAEGPSDASSDAPSPSSGESPS